MPLPLILGVGAGIAGAAGVGAGVHGATKMKKASDIMKEAEQRHKENMARLEQQSASTGKKMDILGELELSVLNGFEEFSNVIEKIQNRPEFASYHRDGVMLPKYDKQELQKASIGAGVLLGGLGGAAIGTAGGFAAAGATTSAVMALGTASTGTAIASLSGVAATNATLAALGGGTLAAGGGGIALGTTVLGATTLGIGLLVGGVIFNFTGKKLSDKAEEAYEQMAAAEKSINEIGQYLGELETVAEKYTATLARVRERYLESFNFISYLVNKAGKNNWKKFTKEEKLALENTVLLVGLLYRMCQVKLVIKAEREEEINTVNIAEVEKLTVGADKMLERMA